MSDIEISHCTMDANDVVGIPVTFWLYHRKLMCTTTHTLYTYYYYTI